MHVQCQVITSIRTYFQLQPYEHNSVKFQPQYKHILSLKPILQCILQNVGHLVQA